MKHTHILFVILAIILCVGCDYIQSPEEAAGENKNDLQYVNMDGLRRELADIRSTSFENLDIKNCAFFDVPDKMYEAKLLQAGNLLQKENQIFESYVPKKRFKKSIIKRTRIVRHRDRSMKIQRRENVCCLEIMDLSITGSQKNRMK